jgi:hypothetical protein
VVQASQTMPLLLALNHFLQPQCLSKHMLFSCTLLGEDMDFFSIKALTPDAEQ